MVPALRVPRRPLAIGLLALAAVAVLLVVAALWNPGRFTALYPLADQGGATAACVLAGALVAAAALMTFAHTGRRAVFGLVAALVAVPALCVGLPAVALRDSFRRGGGTTVLAVSPNGDYSVVKYTVDTATGRETRLYLRSRALLLSRESAAPVARCAFDPFDRGVPPESVRFTSDDTVAVPVRDQPTTVVRLDPNSLAPERTVEMC